MINFNAILYLSSARYSILWFNQLFIIAVLPYWYVAKNIGNYRKYDIFFNFRFTEIWYFRQLGKSKKCDVYVERFYENVFYAVFFMFKIIHLWKICWDLRLTAIEQEEGLIKGWDIFKEFCSSDYWKFRLF